MCLLLRGACVALELVVAAQRLRVGEVPQAARHRRVLLDVDAQVEEVLVLASHSLAIQALKESSLGGTKGCMKIYSPDLCLAREYSLEYVADPGVVVFRVVGLRRVRVRRRVLVRLAALLLLLLLLLRVPLG